MKLKDYIKNVRDLILCYEYSTTFDLANHIVEEDHKYIEENFKNHVPTLYMGTLSFLTRR